MSSKKLRSLRAYPGAVFLALIALYAHIPLMADDTMLRMEGHFNSDCHMDTLICLKRTLESPMYMPNTILWGQGSTSCSVGIAPAPLAQTQLIYNNPAIDGSVSLLALNPNDTLSDIIINLWWKKDSTSAEPDTGHCLVIFGQDRISTMATITVDQITTSQTQSFVAHVLRNGNGLTEEKVRDLTGVKSHRIQAVSVQVQDPVAPPHIMTGIEENAEVRVYPNPVLFTARIEAELPAGSYTAKIVDVNGRVHAAQMISMQEAGSLWREIDVSKLPNGYYIVQIVSSDRVIGGYPFTIMR